MPGIKPGMTEGQAVRKPRMTTESHNDCCDTLKNPASKIQREPALEGVAFGVS